MVLQIDCGKSQAKERFLAREREAGDTADVFDRRFDENSINYQFIAAHYAEKLSRVRREHPHDLQ